MRGKLGCSKASGTMGTKDWKAARILSFAIWNLCFPPHATLSLSVNQSSLSRGNLTYTAPFSLSFKSYSFIPKEAQYLNFN